MKVSKLSNIADETIFREIFERNARVKLKFCIAAREKTESVLLTPKIALRGTHVLCFVSDALKLSRSLPLREGTASKESNETNDQDLVRAKFLYFLH